MRTILVLLLLTATLFVRAQVYHFPETFVLFSKTTDFQMVHGYLSIVNDTTDTVAMRWIARKATNCPPEWEFNFDDQNNNHFPVAHADSDDFAMWPTGAFPQKLIIGLNHHDVPAVSSIFFTVFPVNNRSDSTQIEYRFDIAQAPIDTNDTTPVDTGGHAHGITTLTAPLPFSIRWNGQYEVRFVDGPRPDVWGCYSIDGRCLMNEPSPKHGTVYLIDTAAPVIFIWSQSGRNYVYKCAPWPEAQ